MIGIAAALLAAGGSCAVPQAEIHRQESLAYQSFDSRSGSYSWRSLLQLGCTDAALSLLAAYAAANDTRLTVEQRNELAFSGREAEAIPHFERAISVDSTPEWTAYVAATLAFIRHDVSALAEARQAYASIAPGSMRLAIIDGFVACPSQSYSRAVHCAMQGPPHRP